MLPGIAGIRDLGRGTVFGFNRLDRKQAFNDRQNYYIAI